MIKKNIKRIQNFFCNKKTSSEKAEIKETSTDNAISYLSDVYSEKFSSLAALNVYTSKRTGAKRINLITDSINEGSLYGGVMTSIIFTVLLANKNKHDIRVITRDERPKEFRFKQVLDTINLRCETKVSFLHSDRSGDAPVDVSEDDVFITTSWWSTHFALKSINPSKIIYILQEDERMFYPAGDDQLLCNEVLSNRDIRFVVNTKMLYDHLISTGLENLKDHGKYFEPAFEKKCFFFEQKNKNEKKKLFFYARPYNVRNLFYRGIHVLEKAIAMGIIDLGEWDIYFGGKDLPENMSFSNGYRPKVLGNLNYEEYTKFIRSTDLGFSLMYTPHPSYPPLDLAASGSVVVTNRFGSKKELNNYSENIICADSTVDGLLEGLREGIALSNNEEKRRSQYDNNKMLRDWKSSFNDIVDNIGI